MPPSSSAMPPAPTPIAEANPTVSYVPLSELATIAMMPFGSVSSSRKRKNIGHTDEDGAEDSEVEKAEKPTPDASLKRKFPADSSNACPEQA